MAKSTEQTRQGAAYRAAVKATRLLRTSEILSVSFSAPAGVNYSLLHNQRSVVDELTLTKLTDHPLDDVRIEIELDAGTTKQVFRKTCTIDEPYTALGGEVCLPLTAPLIRSLRERLQTTIYARITWEGRVVHEETQRIALLPVDEWFDDTNANPWLPSFVLPQDPAVKRIISDAKKYLMALTDDPDAGFDGYQSVDVDGNPASAASTDRQVQAIWTAIVNDRDLLYVNPPPAYSVQGQRLRSPSEILESSSGTCIDLSLLMAACLEYVEIHACLVLLTGHCFVGYWRADEYHTDFMTVSRPPSTGDTSVASAARRSAMPLVDDYGWRLGPQCFEEVRDHMKADELRMLEATGLCFGYPFSQAQSEGAENMTTEEDFDSLLDIRAARRSTPPVTPLPIL